VTYYRRPIAAVHASDDGRALGADVAPTARALRVKLTTIPKALTAADVDGDFHEFKATLRSFVKDVTTMAFLGRYSVHTHAIAVTARVSGSWTSAPDVRFLVCLRHFLELWLSVLHETNQLVATSDSMPPGSVLSRDELHAMCSASIRVFGSCSRVSQWYSCPGFSQAMGVWEQNVASRGHFGSLQSIDATGVNDSVTHEVEVLMSEMETCLQTDMTNQVRVLELLH
jgi:hypothetical protein